MVHGFRLPKTAEGNLASIDAKLDSYGKLSMRHPKDIKYCATFTGAILGSFVFVLLLNTGTALLTQKCTVNSDGTSMGVCSYVPGSPAGIEIGTHPEYMANLLLLAVVAFGARYVAQHVAGVWSHGAVDAWFTIMETVKCIAMKDSPVRLGHRLLAIFGQGVGAIVAILCTWAVVGERNAFSDQRGAGLGGPGLSVRGTQSVSRTVFFAMFVAMVRGLVFLWSILERRWTQQTGNTDKMLVKHLNRMDTDHLTVGMTHHARVSMLATVDGVLAVVSGVFFGPSIGFFWRDVLTLAFVSTPAAVTGENKEMIGMWWFSFLYPLVGYLIALIVFLALVWSMTLKYGHTAGQVSQAKRES